MSEPLARPNAAEEEDRLNGFDRCVTTFLGRGYRQLKRRDRAILILLIIAEIAFVIGAGVYWLNKCMKALDRPVSAYGEYDFEDNLMRPNLTIIPLIDTTANSPENCTLQKSLFFEIGWGRFVEAPLNWSARRTPNGGSNFYFAQLHFPFAFSFDPVFHAVSGKVEQGYKCTQDQQGRRSKRRRGRGGVQPTEAVVPCPDEVYDMYLWAGDLGPIFDCPQSSHVPAFFFVPETAEAVLSKFDAYLELLASKASRHLYIGSTASYSFCGDPRARCVGGPANFLANAFPNGVSVLGDESRKTTPQTVRFTVSRTVNSSVSVFGTTESFKDSTSISLEDLHQSILEDDTRGGVVFTAYPMLKMRTLSPSPDPFDGFGQWFTIAHAASAVLFAVFLSTPVVPLHPRWSKWPKLYSEALQRQAAIVEVPDCPGDAQRQPGPLLAS